jgi:hypothetical protein
MYIRKLLRFLDSRNDQVYKWVSPNLSATNESGFTALSVGLYIKVN